MKLCFAAASSARNITVALVNFSIIHPNPSSRSPQASTFQHVGPNTPPLPSIPPPPFRPSVEMSEPRLPPPSLPSSARARRKHLLSSKTSSCCFASVSAPKRAVSTCPLSTSNAPVPAPLASTVQTGLTAHSPPPPSPSPPPPRLLPAPLPSPLLPSALSAFGRWGGAAAAVMATTVAVVAACLHRSRAMVSSAARALLRASAVTILAHAFLWRETRSSDP